MQRTTSILAALMLLTVVQMHSEWKLGFTKVCGLTYEQGQNLMAYHGVTGWKCEDDKAYIKRDGKWIEVLRNPTERAIIFDCHTDMECQEVTGVEY